MSGLHQAVAHAIADAQYGDPVSPAHERAAAAAVGVCLAEAQRAVESLPAYKGMQARPHERMLYAPDVLAALAALAEEQG